jgi:hypothetical protein
MPSFFKYIKPSLNFQATVLEEMPPFPEKEVGGLLNLLKKKRPGRVPDVPELKSTSDDASAPAPKNAVILDAHNASSGSADLLGLGDSVRNFTNFCSGRQGLPDKCLS